MNAAQTPGVPVTPTRPAQRYGARPGSDRAGPPCVDISPGPAPRCYRFGPTSLFFGEGHVAITSNGRAATVAIGDTTMSFHEHERGYGIEIAHNPAFYVAAFVGSASFGEQIIRYALARHFATPDNVALELWIAHCSPLVEKIPPSPHAIKGIEDPHLFRALQSASTLAAAREFSGDHETTRSDAEAFFRTLAVTNDIVTSNRTAMVFLAPAGQRKHLIHASYVEQPPVDPTNREPFKHLTIADWREHVRYGMAHISSARRLGAAIDLGIHLAPGDPATSWKRLEEDALLGGYLEDTTFERRLLAGRIEGYRVRQVSTVRDCVRAGSDMRNCLGQRSHGWPQRVTRRTHLVFTLHRLDDAPVAAFAIETRGGGVVEQYGPGNQPLPTRLSLAIEAAVLAARQDRARQK